jgi:hypothetical protein
MAQVAAIMMLCLPEHKGKLALMGTIDNARFRKPVVPGDTLVTEATVDWIKQAFGKVSLISRVDGQEVARCDMKFAFKINVEPSHDSVYEKITNAYRTYTADGAHLAGGLTDGDPIISGEAATSSTNANGGEADCG